MGERGVWVAVLAVLVLLAVGSERLLARAGEPPPLKVDEATTKVDLGDPMTEDGQARRRALSFGRQHTASPLVIPDQEIPLRFSHEAHLAGGKMQCVDCHRAALGSVRAKDVNLPRESVCLDCHDIEAPDAKPQARCETCHPGYVPRWRPGKSQTRTSHVENHPPAVRLPEPHLKFNHKIHVERGITCARCHGDMSKHQLATRENALPVMGTCLACHDGKQAPDACTTCHVAAPDGRVQTDLPGGKLAPAGWYHQDAHDDDWLRTHRFAASVGDGHCAACHTENECMDCHNGVRKPLKVHPNNWALMHPVAARKNVPDCASCHRSQTFCADCHQLAQVSPDAPNRPPDAVRFHPDGWVDAQGRRGANHHAFEAQRNIRSCASCHTEDTCMECHSVKTLGVNPHPPGFVGSGACERMAAKNARVCTRCHFEGSSQLRCR
ncbi:MAG: cytochrome C [Deltaproteobacteria bacterium]|nr:MAG: cytochrome C [Deltaproteobacteria bacterium]